MIDDSVIEFFICLMFSVLCVTEIPEVRCIGIVMLNYSFHLYFIIILKKYPPFCFSRTVVATVYIACIPPPWFIKLFSTLLLKLKRNNRIMNIIIAILVAQYKW